MYLFSESLFRLPTQSSEPLAIYNLPSNEYEALSDLYYAADGPQWAFDVYGEPAWNFTDNSNPCLDEWAGITCTPLEADGYLHVQNITLSNLGLAGYLPESIGQFSYLLSLDLTAGDFSGTAVPMNISQLQRLRVLVLDFTYFTSFSAASFGKMSFLRLLSLTANMFEGTISEEFCKLTNLEMLDLTTNLLSGPISACFGDLFQMRQLTMDDNYLTGTIPDAIGNLAELWSIGFDHNFITGSVPTAISRLPLLIELVLSYNLMNGTIPDIYTSLPLLTIFSVDNNMFTGPIPASVFRLPELEFYFIANNSFNGTISPNVCNQVKIWQFVAQNNMLSGTLPDCLGRLAILDYLNLNNNRLSGTLPPSMGNLTNLLIFEFNDNLISGPIPDSFANLTVMNYLLGNNNYLSGTFPTNLLIASAIILAIEFHDNLLSGPFLTLNGTASSRFSYLHLGSNRLTGPFPDNFPTYQALYAVNMSNNHMTGSLPASVIEISALNFLLVSENSLTGTLCDGWENLDELSFLYVDNNYFQGSLPHSIGGMARIMSLNMSHNLFSGSIPFQLSEMNQLQVLLLQYNALSGSLSGPMGGNFSMANITTIQVGSNQFSGPLPEDVFSSPLLQVFSAVSNCFTGSLPVVMCSSASLNTLALDGLQSAPSCQMKFLRGLNGILPPNLYTIRSLLTGGLPVCLFQMGNLTTLHLSGNGLTGTLPRNIQISSALRDLSLSHNKLHSTIPAPLLNQPWTNLDLSYNRLSGELSEAMSGQYPSDTCIALEQNRLSGNIPSAYRDVLNISLLESNLFVCDASRSDLPVHDPAFDKYQCDSQTLNVIMYAWVAVTFTLVFLAFAAWWRWQSEAQTTVQAVVARAQEWWAAGAVHNRTSLSDVPHNTRQVFAVAQVIVKVGVICTVWCLVVLMPIYIACTFAYGTYYKQYAWALSAAYLSGTMPFALEFTFLILLVVLAFSAAVVLSNSIKQSTKLSRVNSEDVAQSTWYFRAAVQLVYVIATFAVVIGANVAYVVVALNESGHVLTLAQIALALFKVGFNGMCAPFIIRYISNHILKDSGTRDFVSIQLFISLVNNILIPCFVVAVISPSCFYNVFHQAAAVTSSFQYEGNCLAFDPNSNTIITCTQQEIVTATTSYDPPFAYSYQCSSSFITYYAPAYVIMCILASFAIPIAQVVLQILHGRATPDTRWFCILDTVLPRILKPMRDSTLEIPARNVFSPYFDAPQFLTTLLTYLGLLLTFGAVFPPLALCFLLTIASITAFMRLKVGRFLFNAKETNALQLVEIVNQECAGAGAYGLFRRSMFFIVALSFVFYTLFLFDTLGDAHGVDSSYWVLILVPLLSLLFVPTNFVGCTETSARSGRNESKIGPAVEMSAVTDTENPIHS